MKRKLFQIFFFNHHYFLAMKVNLPGWINANEKHWKTLKKERKTFDSNDFQVKFPFFSKADSAYSIFRFLATNIFQKLNMLRKHKHH